jgi:hypothetical protein
MNQDQSLKETAQTDTNFRKRSGHGTIARIMRDLSKDPVSLGLGGGFERLSAMKWTWRMDHGNER